MVCTRNPELARRMTVMRMHGMDRTTWDRYTSPRASWEYDIVAPGYKFNLPDVLAAIGCCQVERAQLFYEQRKAVVEKYNEAFSYKIMSYDYIVLGFMYIDVNNYPKAIDMFPTTAKTAKLPWICSPLRANP